MNISSPIPCNVINFLQLLFKLIYLNMPEYEPICNCTPYAAAALNLNWAGIFFCASPHSSAFSRAMSTPLQCIALGILQWYCSEDIAMHCSSGYWREMEADTSAALHCIGVSKEARARLVGGLVKEGYCSSSRPETLLLTLAVGEMTLWFSNLAFLVFSWQTFAKII